MAGQLTIDTLKASSGVLATQNGMTGIAKAWVLYNGVGQSIYGSFNVSSVTYNGTGDYTINYSTAMPNINYSALITTSSNSGTSLLANINSDGAGNNVAPTTTTTRVNTLNRSAGATTNSPYVSFAVLSS